MIDDLVAKRAESSDMLTWRILHDDDDGMTYGLPSDKNILEMHLKNANGHIVWRTGYAIGCFSVVVDEMGMATGGIIVMRSERRKGYGSKILKIQEDIARNLGAHSFRCDVFTDNLPTINLMRTNQYRPFVWFEKRL